MEFIGYAASLLIGLSLGLIGGGGSILTVPVLVYLFGLDAISATAYSLFVVGATSLVGAIKNLYLKNIDVKIAAVFAVPSLIAVYTVRRYLMPSLPDTLDLFFFTAGKDIFILMFFAFIMLLAAYRMIIPSKKDKSEDQNKKNSLPYLLIAGEGLAVGGITGFVGAGGGFLIIPALVLLVGLPMKRAVATSLLIISVKSLIGFIGDVQNFEINWSLLTVVTLLAIGGIFIGMGLNQRIDGGKLKKGFGWFVLVMAISMIAAELI